MIKIQPRNKAATEAVQNILNKVDKRLSLDHDELKANICYGMSQAHKASFSLSGSDKLMEALRNTEVFKRSEGRRGHYIHPLHVVYESTWETGEHEPHFPVLINKSGCYYRNSEDALSLTFNDITSINNKKPVLIQIIDMGKTLGSWRNSYKPTLKFDNCDYPEPVDIVEVDDFLKLMIDNTRIKKIPMVQVQDGFVVGSTEAVRFIDSATTRYTGDSQKRFALNVIDSYGRQFPRLGVY